MAKCPHCDKPFLSPVKYEPMVVGTSSQPQLNGIAYVCPLCDAILGVQLDPLALNQELANEIEQRLSQH